MNEKWERKTVEKAGSSHYGQWFYEVTSDSPWNYCLDMNSIRPEAVKENFVVEKAATVPDFPWTVSQAPVKIKTKARRLPIWEKYRGSAGPVAYVIQERGSLKKIRHLSASSCP
ncbi:MAG: hypothetical protein LIP04_10515 [Tannerellaceae bacterium]|nr:hypothetical protein [Tannerellaceae bacterium]